MRREVVANPRRHACLLLSLEALRDNMVPLGTSTEKLSVCFTDKLFRKRLIETRISRFLPHEQLEQKKTHQHSSHMIHDDKPLEPYNDLRNLLAAFHADYKRKSKGFNN